MISSNKKFAYRIVLFIFLPLLMNLFYIQKLNINLSYLIVLIQLMIFIFSINYIKIMLDRNQSIVLIVFFLLFIVAVFSALFSKLQLESFKTTLLVFTTSIFLILLTVSDTNPFATFKKTTVISMNIGMIFSSLAILLFMFGQVTKISGSTVQAIILGPIELYQIIMGAPPYYRVSSLTTNPNSLGIILMISQISTLYLFKTKLISKKKFILFYILQIISLILTQSRGAIITALIMLVLFLLLTNRKILKLIICGTLTIFLIYMYYIINSQYFNIFSRFKTGITDRNLAWSILLEKIIENPFIGSGFGVSDEVLLYDVGIKSHNVFLNCIAEIGVVGFIIFILIWLIGIKYSFLRAINTRNSKDIKYTYALVFSILFSLVFHQVVETKLLVYDFLMFFWVYLITFATMPLQLLNLKLNIKNGIEN